MLAPFAPETTLELCGRLERFFEREQVLDALALAQAHAPWSEWTEPSALITASRLVGMAGDAQLGRELVLRAYRLAPDDHQVAYFHALDRLRRHGAFECLRWLDARGLGHGTKDPATKPEADLLALRARLLGQFRDFTAAERLMDRAIRAFPESGWLRLELSDLLRAQDRYDEALAASTEMLRLKPWRRWALHTHTALLRLRGRDEEALALLQTATEQTQSGFLAIDLASALEETGRHEDILAALDLAEKRLPLATKNSLVWLQSRRCDALYRLGRNTEALAAANEAAEHGAGYYAKIAERMAAPKPDARRVHLPVGFVRQHHMTCAPATIAAVAGYWGRSVDHEKLAAEICYDGTPDHAERAWLEEHGWLVREFTANWDAAKALLNRGCPFLIVTVGVGSAHMQAVIGYDEQLEILLVRDPYERTFTEWNAEGVLKEQAAYGPRGVLLLPPEEAARLDGLALPDTELHDAWFAFRRSLFQHRRADAETAFARLAALADDHSLTHRARRDLAHYDGHPAAAVPAVEALRRLFPGQVNFQVEHIDLLDQLGRTNEVRDLLEELGGGLKKYFTFQRRRAENRLADARTAPGAGRILRRLLRYNPNDADHLRAYANYLWGSGEHADALAVYRLAATAGDKSEHHWRAYFIAARFQRRETECLDLLRARFERWGDASSRPALTLADALEDLDRSEEALAILQAARVRRPNDGDLALHLASKLALLQRHPEATALLLAARADCAPGVWLRYSAQHAERAFEHARALDLWRQVAALSPEDIQAQSSCARLLRICEGRAAALAWLAAACAAAPHLYALRRCHIDWLREEPAEVALAAVDELLALTPDDAWALRERALILRRLGRGAAGAESALIAARIEPRSPASYQALTRCLRDAGRLDKARDAAREGIRLDIDASHLFEDLLLASVTLAERREAVRFIETELARQVSFNAAALDFFNSARSVLTPTELLTALRGIHAAQPNHWSTRSALAACLAEQNQLPEALKIAEDNARRFPLLPRTLLDLADIYRKIGNTEEEIRALQKTLEISPGWGRASRQLADALERRRDPAAAEQALRRAIQLSPTEAMNLGWLADFLWRTQRPAEAVHTIEQALRCDPFYDWGWDRLHDWSLGLHRSSRAVVLAEELVRSRPGEPASWLRLVRLRGDEFAGENLAALAKAESLAPLDIETHDLRAQLLSRAQRWAEALQACNPPVYAGKPPHNLRGREAWVQAQAGRTDDAIKLMQAVLSEFPDYVWGWTQLTEWLARAERLPEAEKAAENWARLMPETPVPRGWLGNLQRSQGRGKDAYETFKRALELHPDYGYAAREMLASQLAARNFAAAEMIVAHIHAHFSRAEYLRALGLLLGAKGEHDETLAVFAELARLPDSQADQTWEVFQAALAKGYRRKIGAELRKLLAEENTHPDLAELWIEAQQKRMLWFVMWSFLRLCPAEIHRRKLMTRYISLLAERKARASLLGLRVWRRKELRADPEWWGEMGFAWTHLEHHRLATHWMRDWRRPDARPYMLSNAALNHFSLNQPAKALPIVRRALEHPSDGTYTKLQGWIALETAIAGDIETARQALATGVPPNDKPYSLVLHGLAEALINFQSLPKPERRQRLAEVLAEVEGLRADHAGLAAGAGLRIHFIRTRRRLASLSGKWLQMARMRLPQISSEAAEPGNTLPYRFRWWHAVVIFLVLRLCLRLANSP